MPTDPAVAPSPEAPVAPSFERVFQEHAPFVWRALRRLGVDAAEARELREQAAELERRTKRHRR